MRLCQGSQQGRCLSCVLGRVIRDQAAMVCVCACGGRCSDCHVVRGLCSAALCSLNAVCAGGKAIGC